MSDASADSGNADATASSGNDGGDAGEGGTWSPSSLSGLVLWLNSTTGIETVDAGADAGAAFIWEDRSGNGNNARSVGSPTIVAAALGGQPVIRFNGSSQYLEVSDSPTLEFGTGEFLVAVVAQHTTPLDAGAGYGFLFSKQIQNASPYPGPCLIANTGSLTTGIEAQVAYGAGDVFSTTTGYNNGTPFYVDMHRFAATSDAGADAAAVATADTRIRNAALSPIASPPHPQGRVRGSGPVFVLRDTGQEGLLEARFRLARRALARLVRVRWLPA